MLAKLWVVSVTVFVGTLLVSFAEAASPTTGGSGELKRVEDKFAQVDLKNEDRLSELVIEAADAVGRVASKPDAKLDMVQVREIVNLLRVADKHDFYHRIMEQNSRLFEVNESAVRAELKKLPPKEAKEILDHLDIVMSDGEGNDIPPAPAAPTTRPASRPKK